MEINIQDIIKKFGLQPKRIIPLRAAYLVDSHRGYYCLKKLNYREDKLLFIYGAKEHLINRGFFNIDTYYTFKSPFVQYKNQLFVMTKYILGRECDFSNPLDIHGAAKNLARLHIASEGYIAPPKSKEKSNLGKWIKNDLKKCEDLIYIKNLVKMKSEKNRIDTLFLRNVDTYYEMGRTAIKILETNGYFKQVKEEKEKRYFVHHDYTYHNVLIDQDGEQHVIDFDYCKYDLRCFDVAQFIMRNMTRFYWDFDMAMELLESYNRIRPLGDQELKIIASLFIFPQRFWRISSRYYFEKYNQSEDVFFDQLNKIIHEKVFFVDFLKLYFKRFL